MAKITARLAAQHEATVLRLSALLAHVKGVAARAPGLELPASVRALAEDQLHAARPFVRSLGRLPAAAPDYGGLAAQLGEVLARLEAFELSHTEWDPARRCVLWRTPGEKLPVRRLHPRPVAPPPVSPRQSAALASMREELVRRLALARSPRAGADDR